MTEKQALIVGDLICSDSEVYSKKSNGREASVNGLKCALRQNNRYIKQMLKQYDDVYAVCISPLGKLAGRAIYF